MTTFRTLTVGEFAFFDVLDGVVALAGGGADGAPIIERQCVRVETVATAGDSVKLCGALSGKTIRIYNAGANALRVFALGNDTLSGVAASVGILQPSGSVWEYHCAKTGAWVISPVPVFDSEVGIVGSGGVGTVAESNPQLHRSVITFSGDPVLFEDDADTGQYGALTLYTFPLANITVLGAVVDLELTLTETWWTDAAEGNVGLGTAAVSDASGLGTTTEDLIADTDIAALDGSSWPCRRAVFCFCCDC